MAPVVCTEESSVDRSTCDKSLRQQTSTSFSSNDQDSASPSCSMSSTASTYSVIIRNGSKIRRHYSKAVSPYFIPISNQKDKSNISDIHSENSNSSMESDINSEENIRQEPNFSRENRSASVSSSGCSSIVEEVQQIAQCRCNSLHTSDYDDEDCESEEDSAMSPNSVLSIPTYKQCHRFNRCTAKHENRNSRTLVEIAMRTIKLIRRNQELQNKLSQLQQETSYFIKSVMANPENKALPKPEIH